MADDAHGLVAVPPRREIRMAIDAGGRRVILDRWGAIEGASAELLISLAEPHEQAMRQGLLPENHPFTPTGRLSKQLRVRTPEALRRRVLRCRKDIKDRARKACDAPPPIDAVIESNQWHGYRLNPDTVRVVAITELTARK
jgi:hypothetical protein